MSVDDPRHTALQAQLRRLPSVDELLREPVVAALLNDFPRSEVVRAIRNVIDGRRRAAQAGETLDADRRGLALEIRRQLFARAQPRLRRVINATGVVLHTGLGRAPLAEAALEAVAETASGYCNLEFDLTGGKRGRRQALVRELLCELTGAEAALVVNNNAAATYLALNSMAGGGGEVVVSRGQLVEIGGSYRLPDIMSAAGCRLVEVGTTNRTHLRDYEKALSDSTRALLRVHTSNYRIVGFTTAPSLAELVELARWQAGRVVVIDDLGSGLIEHAWLSEAAAALSDDATPVTFRDPEGDFDKSVLDLAETDERPAKTAVHAMASEPSVRASVTSGADLTLFSGDKLLGGPQSGVIVGRAELIQQLEQNPLMRALRPGKLTLATLEATLRLYRDPKRLAHLLPTWRALLTPLEALQQRAARLAALLSDTLRGLAEPEAVMEEEAEAAAPYEVMAAPAHSQAGGGALPGRTLPTWVVRLQGGALDADALAAALRHEDPPVIVRRRHGAVLFDVRTLDDDDLRTVAIHVGEALRG